MLRILPCVSACALTDMSSQPQLVVSRCGVPPGRRFAGSPLHNRPLCPRKSVTVRAGIGRAQPASQHSQKHSSQPDPMQPRRVNWSWQYFVLLSVSQVLMTPTSQGWWDFWDCCFCWETTCLGLTLALAHRCFSVCVTVSCTQAECARGMLRSLLNLQTRSEVLAAILAVLCIASPTIEARLKELEPGRGRQAAPQQVQGAASIFAISDAVSEKQKQVTIHLQDTDLPSHTIRQQFLCSL